MGRGVRIGRLAATVWLVAALVGVSLGIPTGIPAAPSPGSDPGPAASFSSNVLVDAGAGNAWTPSLTLGGSRKVHVAWSDDREGYRRIHYANSTDLGATWSVYGEVSGTSGSANAFNPSIAADRTGGPFNGSVYVAWREATGSDGDVYFRRSTDRGASWLPRVRIDTAPSGVSSQAPVIGVTAGGVIVVAWYDSRNTSGLQVFVTRSLDGGVSWNPEVQVSQTPANSALVAIATSGDAVYLAWRELDPSTFVATLWAAASTDAGTTWTSSIVDSAPAPTDRRSPSLHVAGDGTVHLVWIAYGTSGTPAIRTSRSTDRGVTWSPPVRVDDASASPLTYRTPRLASAGGDVYAVWADSRNGDSDIFYSVSEDGGQTWGDGVADTDRRVDDTDSNGDPADDATDQTDPGITSDAFAVYAAWSDRRGGSDYDLYFARLQVGGVLLTEFQDAPAGSEVVEVTVYGSLPISFAGYRLEINAFALDLSSLGTVSPGDHRTIGDPGWTNLTYDIPIDDEGGRIRIVDAAGRVADSIAYGQLGTVPDPVAGESVARHWDGRKYTDDWTRSPAPSWNARNDVPPTHPDPPVVLNEILFNAATPSDAFIELYYPGVVTLDLAGYAVAADAPHPIPGGTVSAADPYLVIRQADAPALFASLSLNGDNVYLYDASGALLDMAGWSSPHALGGSMARVPEGFGEHTGYDDPSSIAAGWRFDRIPTVPLVVLRQDGEAYGDLGDVLTFRLTLVQKQTWGDYIDLDFAPGPNGWNVSLVDVLSGTPLQDHDADTVPDSDLLQPGERFEFLVQVEIPATTPVGDNETVVVSATASLTPLARATVTLLAGTYPRIEPTASVDADPIYVFGTPPPYPVETNLTLTIAGRGSARVRRAPQNVVFLLDRSGSLADAFCPGCFPLLKEAAKTYVDNMTTPDMGAVVYFTSAPIPKGPLTTNYAQIKSDIDSETAPIGGTQIGEAIRAANAELSARGNRNHFWAIILLTDGQDNPGGLDPLNEARASAAIGARIFTIGLGPAADAVLLQNIAAITGGEYLYADGPEDLFGVYERIGTIVETLAGYDSDLTDDVPMVEVTLPPYISIAPRPFVDPETGSPRPPDWTGTRPAGTALQWNVSTLRLGETWSVRFTVESSQTGRVDVLAYPESRATYARWDGQTITLPFPRTEVTVLDVVVPTVRYTITRSPLAGAVLVDGVTYPAPTSFDWEVGGDHTIEVPVVNPFGPDSRYLFEAWDDGGAPQHDIVVGDSDATITATFWVQHRPTVRLLGTDAVHDVGLRYTAAAGAATARASGTWTAWVDEGTSLDFDALAAGSGTSERWITEEAFSGPPWTSVEVPFTQSVVYYHQYWGDLTAVGLSPSWPAPVASTSFGRPSLVAVSAAWNGWVDAGTDASIADTVAVSNVERYRTEDVANWRAMAPLSITVRYHHQWSWSVALVGLDDPDEVTISATAYDRALRVPGSPSWSDWLDDGSRLEVDDRVAVGPRERYAARDPTSWDVVRAGDVTVRYAHEARPLVVLLGTDEDHTVGVWILTAGAQQRVEDAYDEWTEWVEVGTVLEFDGATGGSPARVTEDLRTFQVAGPFDATIVYAPPREANVKPFVAAVFVAVLVGVGLVVVRGRPLGFAGSRKGRGPQAIRRQVARDRRRTALLFVAPVAALEGAIGIASYLTDFLRIPEGGTWLSLGLVVNTVILAAGVLSHVALRFHGYDAIAVLNRAAREEALATVVPPPPTDEEPEEHREADDER